MKAGKFLWGIGLIVLAVAMILGATGILSPLESAIGDISILSLVFAVLLLVFAVTRVICGKIGEIFLPLALIFILFEKNIARACGLPSDNIINNWLVVCCAVLMWVGFSILFSKNTKDDKHERKGKSRKEKRQARKSGDYTHYSMSSSSVYIDASDFTEKKVWNDLGELVVRFTNREAYKGNGVLYLSNHLGSTTVEVPYGWRISMNVENHLGDVNYPDSYDCELEDGAPVINIDVTNSFGDVKVKYV